MVGHVDLPLRQGHHVVNDSPAGRVGRLRPGLEEPGVDPLADDDVGELQLGLAQPRLLETFLQEQEVNRGILDEKLPDLDRLDLVLYDVWDLAITNSVPDKPN